MRAIYANCFAPDVEADLLITEEPGVAAAARHGAAHAILADSLIDADRAQAATIALWDLAFRWADVGGDDETMVDGVSAADLGGGEAVLRTLIPAGRGALGMLAALDAGATFEDLTTVVALGGSPAYAHTEHIQSAAAAAAARSRLGASLPVRHARASSPRNAALFAKYTATRDVDSLGPGVSRGQLGRSALTRAANAVAVVRGRRSRQRTLLVYDYNPTRAFAQTYGARSDRAWRLARHRCSAHEVPGVIAAGDRLMVAPPYPKSLSAPSTRSALSAACNARTRALHEAFNLEGVSLWPVVGEALVQTAERHAAFAHEAIPALRRSLERLKIDAVLVPFESPPEARAIVRVAQAMGIPTHILSDGVKLDDFTVDGTLADVALSWSASMAENYYARRRHGRVEVTGNPKSDRQTASWRPHKGRRNGCRILVGSFTFSPADINCRRSDPEQFLENVLDGIARSSRAGDAEVTLKLHPADRIDHYKASLDRYGHLRIAVVDAGDVVAMFAEHDIYITTYSTSLIEAVPLGLPVIYHRVNPQRLHPPFSRDDYLGARTATSAEGIAQLLDDPGTFDVSDAAAANEWAERYLGPTDGQSAQRVIDAIDATLTRLR